MTLQTRMAAKPDHLGVTVQRRFFQSRTGYLERIASKISRVKPPIISFETEGRNSPRGGGRSLILRVGGKEKKDERAGQDCGW